MRSFLLCATSVLLCVSVMNAFRNDSTTEAQRTTELHGEFDAKAFYKSNCEECHGAAAEKRFNPDNPESQMIDAILNGAQAEDAKEMPAFNQKGIDEQRAKALIAHMKSLRE